MYMHLMPFFCQAIPNHLCRILLLLFLFSCMARFQCSDTNDRASESLLLHRYYFLISLDTFQRRLLFILQPGVFCLKAWCVGHTTRTNNAPAARFVSTQPHIARPGHCHHMNRTVNCQILGLTAAVATALLLVLIARDDIGILLIMVREDALIGASIMIAAVAGISSRKVRE